ncbi:efflux RND transporter periplasmic adaptor subunit [Lacisediminimonas profundi]|uniref:efflux RND transporter periplasmic adaptor subunit n=1 Tax=Lacisediminimonas profundi TaxID=2603856 RepID=UPI00124B2835|nr:efflux RND transporter periplasmic adaptor subunit [Lacisediminimonas profundi]
MNFRSISYSAVAVVGIALLGGYAYYSQRAPQKPKEQSATAAPGAGGQRAAAGPVAVEVVRVDTMRMVDELNSVGTLRSNESVILRPEVAGRIVKLNFRDGQMVKKGQQLVAFDSSVNQAEVGQARAELNIAQSNYRRNEDLASRKFISERAKDESQANVQVLEAKLALAQARLSKLEIRAPFSGVVGIRTVSVGDYVKDGADLVNLEDLSSVKVDFRIPEKYADLVRPGQGIEVMLDALPGQTFKARVDAIDPQVDSTGRSALLRGRIENPQGRLKPGMFARVRLILAQRDQALVVPEEAIVPQGQKQTVWKVVDGKALRTEVKIGLRRNAKAEIVEGLEKGDVVVTAGQIRLSRDGMAVRIGGGQAAGKPDGQAVAARQ